MHRQILYVVLVVLTGPISGSTDLSALFGSTGTGGDYTGAPSLTFNASNTPDRPGTLPVSTIHLPFQSLHTASPPVHLSCRCTCYSQSSFRPHPPSFTRRLPSFRQSLSLNLPFAVTALTPTCYHGIQRLQHARLSCWLCTACSC